MATILTKKKDTTGAPSAGDLTNSSGGAELAVNTADKRLYTKDSGGNVVEVGINPTSITTGTLNTSGAVVFNDAGADVDFRVEGDTDANLLFVDASADKVGIGTSSPATKLHVVQTTDANTDGVRITRSSNSAQYGVFANYGGATWLTTVDTAGNGNNVLVFNRSSDGSTFSESMRITSDGYLRMASGSGGIQFGGDTAAANALDDYEEGTFTPTIVGTTVAGTGTYTIQNAHYTKIGNRVFFRLTVVWSAHTGTGNLRVSGLPFTAAATGFNDPATTGANNLTFSGQLISYVSSGTTSINVFSFATGATEAPVAMDTDASLYISGHYHV